MAQPYVGEIRMFAGNFNPAGWELCNGQLLASLRLGGRTWGGVSVVGGSVFVATGDQFDTGYIVAYRPRR